MVHQHFMLVDNFTVTQNIVLGSEVCSGAGVLDMKKAREKVCQIIEQYGLEVDPDAKIEDISVGMQQRVEILKALYRGADILILDEPTAVLTPQEIDRLIPVSYTHLDVYKRQDVLHELVHDVVGEDVDAVVVVAVLGEVALDVEVDDDALLIADRVNLGVLDGGQGVSHDGEMCIRDRDRAPACRTRRS